MFEGIQSHVAHQEYAQQEERGALPESIRELRLIHTDGYHLGHVHRRRIENLIKPLLHMNTCSPGNTPPRSVDTVPTVRMSRT